MLNEPIFWTAFEMVISLLENFLLLDFLTKFLGFKNSGKGARLSFLCAWGIGFGFSFFENVPSIVQWEFLITIVWCFLYALFFLNGSLVKKAFAAILTRSLTSISNSLVLFICSYLFQQDISSFVEKQDIFRVLIVSLSKVIYIFAGRLILGFARKDKKLLSWQWAIAGASFLFSTLAGTTAIVLGKRLEFQQREQMQLMIIVVCVWAMCLATYFLVGRMARDNEIKLEYALLKQQREYQEKSLELVKAGNEEIAQIKHDMRNCILTIETLINQQSYQAAEQECERIAGKVECIQTLVQTGNESIDAILNEKLSESKRRGINTKCSIFADLTDVDSMAFCSVVGNLMDNAIEAEEKLPLRQRKIEVLISGNRGFVDLVIKNVIAASVLQTNSEMHTSKSDTSTHGIGHTNVKKAMRECGGSIRYSEDGNNFLAIARFPTSDENE